MIRRKRGDFRMSHLWRENARRSHIVYGLRLYEVLTVYKLTSLLNRDKNYEISEIFMFLKI
jgi:hypothetical protein